MRLVGRDIPVRMELVSRAVGTNVPHLVRMTLRVSPVVWAILAKMGLASKAARTSARRHVKQTRTVRIVLDVQSVSLSLDWVGFALQGGPINVL